MDTCSSGTAAPQRVSTLLWVKALEVSTKFKWLIITTIIIPGIMSSTTKSRGSAISGDDSIKSGGCVNSVCVDPTGEALTTEHVTDVTDVMTQAGCW